ncbi:MAG: hypothetical protein D6701_00795 [Gemmatimonadetes bacterium]|nr:MAG: hypothetical protein D6701_00795 [Gemmatimonadota bacterium]
MPRSTSGLLTGLTLTFFALGTLAQPERLGAQEGDYLYRVLTVRAAPGHLLELIDLLDEQRGVLLEAGDEDFFWMRHSQGDQWDLMVLYPMGSFAEYYAPERVRARAEGSGASGRSGAELQRAIDAVSAFREELFARGPDPAAVRARYEGAGLFHVEMFVALADRRDELLEQRRMENRYYAALEREPNMIFVREAGAGWDLFTLGFYESLQAFAAAGDIPADEEDRAARAAGFEAANRIGTYLRSLMLRHNDTLAGTVR